MAFAHDLLWPRAVDWPAPVDAEQGDAVPRRVVQVGIADFANWADASALPIWASAARLRARSNCSRVHTRTTGGS